MSCLVCGAAGSAFDLDKVESSNCKDGCIPRTSFYTKTEVDELLKQFGTPEQMALFFSKLEFNQLDTIHKTLLGAINELEEDEKHFYDKSAVFDAINSMTPEQIRTILALADALA